MSSNALVGRSGRPALFILILLAIEFLDELVQGTWEAAWPLIRDDLALTYGQIGILLAAPRIIGAVLGPPIAVLGDAGHRRKLVLLGGLGFAASLALAAASPGFVVTLVALTLFSPSSGGFVGLAQSTLMDLAPDRRESNMARWALAGSIGWTVGPMLLAASLWVGTGWRGALVAIAIGVLVVAWSVRRARFDGVGSDGDDETDQGFVAAMRDALRAARNREVLRWLTLLQCSDLILDVLHGFLALYFVDVAGSSAGMAAFAVAVWAGVGLVGDAALVPLLERFDGVRYLRASAVAVALVYAGFLLAPSTESKLVLVGLLGVLNAGWYAILKARLYAAMPGRSGSVNALADVADLGVSVAPLALGMLAERVGLGPTMWVLMLGPIALLVGLPRESRRHATRPRD
jgi:MFS transporter, FSR family, fosmidomycin resistance protein